MSLPSHLRAHKDLTRDETTRELFNIPKGDDAGGQKGMEINAVLSIEGEAVFVSLWKESSDYSPVGSGPSLPFDQAEDQAQPDYH